MRGATWPSCAQTGRPWTCAPVHWPSASCRTVYAKTGEYQPGADAIQVMTMKVSKGLEFPVVALPGVGHMPAPGEDEKEAARVFYVAATRATQRLVMGVGAGRGFGGKFTQ